MPGSHKGVRVGACTDCRNNWAKFRAGAIDIEDIAAVNEELAPTVREPAPSMATDMRKANLLSKKKKLTAHGKRLGRNLRRYGHC